MRLSIRGVELFLECHCRLARLVHEFIPYGVTLYVAIALLERIDISILVDELTCGEWTVFAGELVHFVGTSPALSAATDRIAERLAASDLVYPLPQTWKLYIVALQCFRAAEDDEILHAHDQVLNALKARHPNLLQPASDGSTIDSSG